MKPILSILYSLFRQAPLALTAALVAIAPLDLRAAPADFTVESPVDGKTFKLSEARGKYVALHFLLKTECPFCLKHTHDYAMRASNLPEVVQIFLKPDSAEEIKKWAPKLGAGNDAAAVSIYHDGDAKLATEFGVKDGYQFHGQTVRYPALILLDPSGREVFRYTGRDNTDRFSFDQLKAKLAELQTKPAALDQYNLGPDKVALQGFDPVGYFTQSKAVKGRPEIAARLQGVTYQFATEENKKLFLAAPSEYLPTYGGWCATAMAKGEKVEIDPANFKITNSRLFLFYKGLWGNARKDWDKDEPAQTTKADSHWKKIAGE